MSRNNLIYFALVILEFLSEPVKGKFVLDRTCHKFLCKIGKTNKPKFREKFRLKLTLKNYFILGT